jgi:hypothetical protein
VIKPEEIIAHLIALEKTTPEKAPKPAVVASVLNKISTRVFAYLGYNPFPADYTDEVDVNSRGRATLKAPVPIINVTAIVILVPQSQPIALKPEEVGGVWGGGWQIAIPYSGRLGSFQPINKLRVSYRAGYDPPDPILSNLVNGILLDLSTSAWDASQQLGTPFGDLSFLGEREIQSISSPGGASESYRFENSGGGGGGGSSGLTGSAIDAYLLPLERYRQKRYV